jgi:hypothetical protein
MTNIIDITQFLDQQPHTRHEILLDFEITRPHFKETRDVVEEAYYDKGNKDRNAMSFAKSIIADLKSCGTFYRCDPYLFYCFENIALVHLDPKNPLFGTLLENYGVVKSHKAFSIVNQMLQNHCYSKGTISHIRHFAHYDKENGVLYRSNFSNHTWRIAHDGITIIQNGKDEVMFRNSEGSTILDHHATLGKGLFDEIVLLPLIAQLDNENEYGISVDDQMKILEYWIYSLFFESIQHTKPIMCALGPAGSGKTSVLRRIGRILFGPGFDVRTMPENRKDFDSTVLRNSYLVFDNVDGFRPWMCDGLSQVATGATLEYRKLYSDFDTTREDPHCFLGITARTPKFARDDVSSRCLFLHTQKIKDVVSEEDLALQINSNRNALALEMNEKLQRIVKSLHENPESPKTAFRMGDFASFCLRAARGLGEESELRSILDRISGSQSTFTLENSSFADVFRLWASEFLLDTRLITLETVRSEMTRVAEGHKIELRGLNRPHSFRSQFTTSLDSLRNIGFRIQPTSDKDNKRHKVWRFALQW